VVLRGGGFLAGGFVVVVVVGGGGRKLLYGGVGGWCSLSSGGCMGVSIWNEVGDGVLCGGDRRVVWRGWYGADMCGPISAATSFSSAINPHSTNSRIVCRCKDRGGCSRRRSCSYRFCLIW
jgi:hypothetical protein